MSSGAWRHQNLYCTLSSFSLPFLFPSLCLVVPWFLLQISFWTQRLKQRLTEWYLRRSILRELIEDAERADSDHELEVDLEQGSRKDSEEEEPRDDKKEQTTEGGGSEATTDVPRGGPNENNDAAKAEHGTTAPETMVQAGGGIGSGSGGGGVEETKGNCGDAEDTKQQAGGEVDKGMEERNDGEPAAEIIDANKGGSRAGGVEMAEVGAGGAAATVRVVKKRSKKKPRRLTGFSHKKTAAAVQQQRPPQRPKAGGGAMGAVDLNKVEEDKLKVKIINDKIRVRR